MIASQEILVQIIVEAQTMIPMEVVTQEVQITEQAEAALQAEAQITEQVEVVTQEVRITEQAEAVLQAEAQITEQAEAVLQAEAQTAEQAGQTIRQCLIFHLETDLRKLFQQRRLIREGHARLSFDL